ncbi:ribonuclease P protein component [Mycobacterium kyorinense]|uniref:Ribonuclease P protein component n=2 Tax=Mycobacterium kyorinense TaxID=487514 RepID=A0A1A2Z484_9MYCO|nr:ribonuclease P protein component [Mycobacterium kyorinense]
MTRSADFDATVKHGRRAVQPDVVIHARQGPPAPSAKIGLIIAKSVGSAVERHRVARRLRHVARAVLPDLDDVDQVVIRALPSSRHAISPRLEQQLRTGLERIRQATGPGR